MVSRVVSQEESAGERRVAWIEICVATFVPLYLLLLYTTLGPEWSVDHFLFITVLSPFGGVLAAQLVIGTNLPSTITIDDEGVVAWPTRAPGFHWAWGRLTPIAFTSLPRVFGLYTLGLRSGRFVVNSCYLTRSQVQAIYDFAGRPAITFLPPEAEPVFRAPTRHP